MNLMDELKLLLEPTQYEDIQLPSLDAFSPKFTNPATSAEIEKIENALKVQIFNFKTYLAKKDSEAQFRAMFWDAALTNLFYGHVNGLNPVNDFELMSEWNIKTLFPELESRKVDFTAVWSGIPLLVIEMGNEEFDFGVNSHKDFTKSLGVASQSCRKLALKLEAVGKGAENAKIFGIWIGGTQIQFFTGQAVVTSLGSGEWTVHCNCNFPREWKFNVLKPMDAPETVAGVNESESPTTPISSEPTIISSSELLKSPLLRLGAQQQTSLQLSSESPVKAPSTPIGTANVEMIIMKEELLAAPEDVIIDTTTCIDLESDEEPEQEVVDIIAPRQKLIGVIDLTTLVVSDRFISELINYVKSIPELKSAVPPRKFRDPEQDGFIPKSRASTAGVTPLAQRLKEAAKQGPSSLQGPSKKSKKATELEYYDDFYISEGRTIDELNIFRKYLSQNPLIFPKLVEYFDSEGEGNEGLFDLVIENMEPLLHNLGNTTTVLSPHMRYKNSAEALLKAVKFTIEILNSLDLLHSTFGLVHSDISPNNIMYSLEFGVWKMTDFGDSMDIALSSSISRVAGTSEYISPESLETGIFTAASDVFSLGGVIKDVLYYKMAYQFESRSRKNDLLFALFCKFEEKLFEMLNPNPIERISVRDALLDFYGILRKFPSSSYDPDMAVYLRIGALYEEAVALENLELGLEQTTISAKRFKSESIENIQKSYSLMPGEFK